jgi:3-oxoadipate enol-lactonase
LTRLTVDLDGTSFACALDGPRDAAVVMLSNSLAADLAMWDGQIPALGERYRVVRYDTRGHGGTAATPGPYTMESLAGDARALLERLGIEKVHFVGLSLGGMTGQYLGANHPELLLSLTLCDTAAHMSPASAWDERIAAARSGGMAGIATPTLERWFTSDFRQANPEDIERIRKMILATSVEGFTGCGAAIREMDQRDSIAGITTPTRVIVGAQDPATTVAHAELIHQKIAGSELVVIDNAAHLSNIEQPGVFNEALLDFLDRQ